MASVSWLANHFFAKSPQRFNQIAKLPINDGDKVIDFGCGPGFYTRYFADLVGPRGLVTGVDHDPVSLDFAESYLSAFPYTNWNLCHSDVDTFLSRVSDYNVVTIFNCIGYFNNPTKLLKNIAKNIQPGGKIIVKDFDMASIFLSPVDRKYFSNLIEHAEKNNRLNNPLKFDNFFGRNVPHLHKCFCFKSHSSCAWTQIMSSPFNKHEIKYIAENIQALVLQASNTCDSLTLDYFKNEFSNVENSFFTKSNAMFLENEYVTTLFV